MEDEIIKAVFVKRYKNCEIYKSDDKYIIYNLREKRLLDIKFDKKSEAKELIKML